MAKNKTTETTASVVDFIDSFVDDAQKKADSLQLIALMQQWSGCAPAMWGPSIIGFDSYHYKYDSGHEGDAPVIGFSPRKAAFSLYVYSPTNDNEKYLDALGKFRMAKSCIYVKKLADINLDALENICRHTLAYIHKRYPQA